PVPQAGELRERRHRRAVLLRRASTPGRVHRREPLRGVAGERFMRPPRLIVVDGRVRRTPPEGKRFHYDHALAPRQASSGPTWCSRRQGRSGCRFRPKRALTEASDPSPHDRRVTEPRPPRRKRLLGLDESDGCSPEPSPLDRSGRPGNAYRMRATDDGDGRLRVAVVGAMGFGAFHLRALQDLTAAAVLTAVVDPRPAAGEVLEMLGRAPQYASLTDLLAEQRPDIVVIASPIPTHAPLAEEAMRAGCHLLLEKPPTASLAEYESLIAVAQETGRVVQVGFQADGSSAYDAISAAVAAGEIGEVRGVGAVGTWVRATSYFARAPWAGRRRLDSVDVVDGVVTNPLAHAVQAALRLAGARRAEDVAAVEAELFRANDIEADDTSSIRVITATGLPV